MQLTHDPSISSYYVTDAFYRELVENFTDWQRDELAIDDLAERDRFRMLVEQEARLLDQLRFDEWLAMYAPECIYWVPGTPQAGDPAPRDRDLVRRPPAHGGPHLSPAHRLCLVAGAEVAHRADGHQRRGVRRRQGAARMVRSNILISEFRVDGTRYLSGWCGHRFVEQRRAAGRSRCGRST